MSEILDQIWQEKWLFLHNRITYEYQTKNHLWDLLRRAHREFNALLGICFVMLVKIYYLGIFHEKFPDFPHFLAISGISHFHESLTKNNFETKNNKKHSRQGIGSAWQDLPKGTS